MARWSSKLPQLVSTCKSGEQGGIHASKTKHGSRKPALRLTFALPREILHVLLLFIDERS